MSSIFHYFLLFSILSKTRHVAHFYKETREQIVLAHIFIELKHISWSEDDKRQKHVLGAFFIKIKGIFFRIEQLVIPHPQTG